MQISDREKRERAEWEASNNPEFIAINDPELGGIGISVEAVLLIAPDEFASFQKYRRLRRLAIEQKAFKPAPETPELREATH